jgi:hypothetical protein
MCVDAASRRYGSDPTAVARQPGSHSLSSQEQNGLIRLTAQLINQADRKAEGRPPHQLGCPAAGDH